LVEDSCRGSIQKTIVVYETGNAYPSRAPMFTADLWWDPCWQYF